MEKFKIIIDEAGKKIVAVPDIIFKNKQDIDWKSVERYLLQYVGEIIEISDTKDKVHLGNELPDEYSGSKYTKNLKGARAKAKANAAQCIREIVEIAEDKMYSENNKEKHSRNAGKGWYYYTTRFTIPIYDNEKKTEEYVIYSARIVVNHARNGKMYLYDLVDIKKEASNPLKTNN